MAVGLSRRVSLPFMVTGALLLMTACGSGSGSGGSSGDTSPIHFDDQGAFTGVHIATGLPILEGDKAAAYVINQAGGIMGRKLVTDVVDDVGDEADAVPALNRELAVNNPAFIVGFTGDEIHGVQSIFDQHHVPDGWNGGDVAYDKNPDKWLWRCNPSDSQLGVAVATQAYQSGYKTAVLFISSSATTQTLVPIIQRAYEALGGKVLSIINITPGQTNYTTEVQQAVSLHPDVILTQMEPSTGAVALAEFKQINNLAIPFVGTDLTGGSDFIKAIGPSVARASFVSIEGSNALTSAGASFVSAYKTVNGHAPLGGSAFAYDCVIDFALAMTAAKTADPNVWVNNITQVSNPPGTQVSDYKTAVADLSAGMKIDYQGASGPMDFNQYHNVTGAWDVVRATGDAAGDIETVKTITADQIQQVVNKMGSS